jgi:hypothetical protein
VWIVLIIKSIGYGPPFPHIIFTPLSRQDLARTGTSLGVCPYYGSRALVAEADLLLMPYSTLLGKETRCETKCGLEVKSGTGNDSSP